jgi:hypothetical protein
MFQSFALLNSFRSGYRVISFVLFSVLLLQAKAQSCDYKLCALDSAFTMEVSRDQHEVRIVVLFTDAAQYDHAMIEKTDELKNEFRQCAYIAMAEEKKPAIEKRDKYPRISTDSFYRLRTITKEGIERTYPPIRLPGIKE